MTGKTHRTQLDHCSLYTPMRWHVTQCQENSMYLFASCLVQIWEIKGPGPQSGHKASDVHLVNK